MLGDVVGYAMIKNQLSEKEITAKTPSEFFNCIVRVMEFTSSDDGGILCMNNKATELAMIEKSGIVSSFKCSVHNDIICPEGWEIFDFKTMEYIMRCQQRKGGYNHIVKSMVIGASLHKGVFNDSILWQKQ